MTSGDNKHARYIFLSFIKRLLSRLMQDKENLNLKIKNFNPNAYNSEFQYNNYYCSKKKQDNYCISAINFYICTIKRF